MTTLRNPERVVAWILGSVIVGFGFLVLEPLITKTHAFVAYLGFVPNQAGTPLAWLLAALVATYYVWGAAKLPLVREHMFHPTALKLLAVGAAPMVAVVEEVIFRKWCMDYVDRLGAGAILQVLASGIAFGVGHAVWGLLGRSFDAALHAMMATGILGAALAIVYLAADRSLAPCIAAHFVISTLIEPGLMVAGMRGQLGLRAKRA